MSLTEYQTGGMCQRCKINSVNYLGIRQIKCYISSLWYIFTNDVACKLTIVDHAISNNISTVTCHNNK